MRTTWIRVLLAVAIAAASLIGCGGGTDSVPSVTATFGPEGGTLTGPDGVQVIVPAGALSQSTTIGIARTSAGAPSALDTYPVSGYVYELTPHGLNFNVPVTVRAPLGNSADTQVFMASPGQEWRAMSANLVNGFAEWERSSFSWLYTGLCSVPASMASDPYWCASALTGASLTAAPTSALVQTAFARDPAHGDWGAYRVDQAATLQFKQYVKVPANCSNVSVRLLRRRYVDIAHLYDVTPVTVATMTPTMVADTHYLTGYAIFPVSFSSDDTGGNQFVLATSFDCPTIVGSSATGYSWDNVHLHHTDMWGDGMLVTGNVPVPAVLYSIAGNVSGLSGTGLVLQNNGTNATPVSANGSFSFSSTLGAGASYNVTVSAQPTGQSCTVSNGSGTANANVTNVAVSCVSFLSIGGTVSGLVGTGLVLQNNGADNLAFSNNGVFSFATLAVAGTAYNVTVLTQPSGSNCTVANGSGTVNANITNVAVSCVAPLATGGLALVANSGVTNGTNGLSVYRADSSTGALSFLSNVNAGNTPYAITIAPNGLYAYVTNQIGGTVSSYSIDKVNGVISLIPLSSPGSNNASGIAMDRLGRYIWVANYGYSTLSSFAIGANGVLAAAGAPMATLSAFPYAITAHPTMDFVYVANQSSNYSVTVYSVNPTTGALTLQQTVANVVVSAAGIVIDPLGRFAYAVSQVGGISAFRIDASTGLLTYIGAVNSSGSTFAIAANPNGQYVYVTDGSSSSNNVLVFAINPTTGALTPVGSPVSAGNNPRGLTVNAAGTYLYVTNYSSNDVSVFSIGSSGATLTSSGAVVGAGSQPQGIAITP